MSQEVSRASQLEQELGLSLARLVILKSDDPEADAPQWSPVDPAEVPDWIRMDPEIVSALMQGLIAHVALDPIWYRAVVVPDGLPGQKDAQQ